MKFTLASLAFALGTVNAAYPKDIVQYWVDQTAFITNSTQLGPLGSGNLQSPAWGPAIVHGSILLAAKNTKGKSREIQQAAVSHAAHNALIWHFHGGRVFGITDAALRSILAQIGLAADSPDDKKAREIGRDAAKTVLTARSDDGNNDFVDYVFQPAKPGVYQRTPGGADYPDVPQMRTIKLFANVGDVKQFEIEGPPAISSPDYEKYLLEVKEMGVANSTKRTLFQTETAYYWRESPIILWNRLAGLLVGDSLANDVYGSAKFYAQLAYSLANAGVAGWHAKYQHNAWRPVTAIQRSGIWLPSGHDVSDPNWTPLLLTPSHMDYVSTHATFGAAAAEVLRTYIGKDIIDVQLSSKVNFAGYDVITRHYTNLTAMVEENGDSRVYGGIHFAFAKVGGVKIGTNVAKATLKKFENNWDKF